MIVALHSTPEDLFKARSPHSNDEWLTLEVEELNKKSWKAKSIWNA